MLRRSHRFLESGTIVSWAPKKNFGFAAIGGDENNKIFIHQSAIVQPRNSRPLYSLRRGLSIEFDITKDDQGRTTAKNVTLPNGQTFTHRDEIPATTVDIRSLRARLVSNDAEDDSRHNQALKGIVQSLGNIANTQSRIATMNRNIFRLLDAMAEKEGVKDILAGEDYNTAKQKIMVNVIREAEERRAKKAKGEAVDDEEDEEEDEQEEVAPVEAEEETKKSKKSSTKKAATTQKAKDTESEYHSADDLLDLMESDEATEKKSKSKKSKK